MSTYDWIMIELLFFGIGLILISKSKKIKSIMFKFRCFWQEKVFSAKYKLTGIYVCTFEGCYKNSEMCNVWGVRSSSGCNDCMTIALLYTATYHVITYFLLPDASSKRLILAGLCLGFVLFMWVIVPLLAMCVIRPIVYIVVYPIAFIIRLFVNLYNKYIKRK